MSHKVNVVLGQELLCDDPGSVLQDLINPPAGHKLVMGSLARQAYLRISRTAGRLRQ